MMHNESMKNIDFEVIVITMIKKQYKQKTKILRLHNMS